MPQSQKIRVSHMAASLGKRVFSPKHAAHALRLHMTRKRSSRAKGDSQLALYSQLIGDFLHLGYFEEDIQPEDMSLNQMKRAQARYCEKVLAHIQDKELPVLDVGCGTGAMLKILLSAGFKPLGLTPDDNQVSHIKTTSLPVLHTRFEDLSCIDQPVGTLLTMESLQYLDPQIVFSKVRESLSIGGRWIICDYLNLKSESEKKPSWNSIYEGLKQHNFKIIHDEDITKNILPTIRFLYFLGEHFGMPLFDYMRVKLQNREPGIYYLLDEVIREFRDVLLNNLAITDPDRFTLKKNYRLLVAIPH